LGTDGSYEEWWPNAVEKLYVSPVERYHAANGVAAGKRWRSDGSVFAGKLRRDRMVLKQNVSNGNRRLAADFGDDDDGSGRCA
jgi:hypothetical protein